MAGLRAELVLSVNDTQAKRSMERSAAELNRIMGGVGKQQVNFKVNSRSFTQPLGRITGSANEFTKSLEASNARVIAFGASVGIINGISDAFKNLVGETIKFEKTLADVNVVLDASNASLQKFGQGLFDVAKNTSQSFGVAAEAALEFSRQGLTMEEVLKRTNDALTLTRLTGLKAAEAVSGLTAAVNAFSAVGLTTTQVIDKLAAVDVKFAVSSEDLINALERTGAVAIDAGVELDSLIGLVTSLQQTTARGGAVIGNGLKTIFTRIQRPKSLEQIENLNIAVRNLSGAVLPADKILINMAKSFDTLTSSQKSNVVQFSAGIFQANVFRAALRDLAKNQSIQSQATQVSAGAAGEAAMKNEKLNKTIAALASQSGTAIQELASAMGDLMVKPEIGGFLEFFKDSIEGMRDMLGGGEEQGSTFAKGLVAGIGNIITGPAAIAFGAVFIKLFMNIAKFAQGSLKDVLDIVTRKDKIRKIEESILETLSKNKDIQESLNNLDGDREQQGKFILKVIEAQTNAMREQEKLAAQLARPLLDAGVKTDLTVGGRGPVDLDGDGIADTFGAGGVLPSSARKEKREASRGGYSAGAVDSMSIKGLGKVVYNKAETVKQFPGMQQAAIMPPRESRAGSRYQDAFSQKHGFDPYAARGFVPNFAELYKTNNFSTADNNIFYKTPLDVLDRTLGTMGEMSPETERNHSLRDRRSNQRRLLEQGYSREELFASEYSIKRHNIEDKILNDLLRGDATALRATEGFENFVKTVDTVDGRRHGGRRPKIDEWLKTAPPLARDIGNAYEIPSKELQARLDHLTWSIGEFHHGVGLSGAQTYDPKKFISNINSVRDFDASARNLVNSGDTSDDWMGRSLSQQKGLLSMRGQGFVPSFNSKDSLQVIGKYQKGAQRGSGGFVPNFATLNGDALRLNQSKMHLYANPREVTPGGDEIRNAMMELVNSGKPVTVRAAADKLYQGGGGSHTKAIKGLIRFIADQENGPKIFERDFKLTNLPWRGNKGEDASEDAVAKALNKGGAKYINTGKRLGAHGDKTFPVDLIGEGLDPVEVKSGEWKQPNILLKSMRLYSDDELMQFAERQYGATPEMLTGARREKLGKSARLLQGKGLLDPDASLGEQHEAALKYGVGGGFVPNFAGAPGGRRENSGRSKVWNTVLEDIESWVAANGGTTPDKATLQKEAGKDWRKLKTVKGGNAGDTTFVAAKNQLGPIKLKQLQDYIAAAERGATRGTNMTAADIGVWAKSVNLRNAGYGWHTVTGRGISNEFPAIATGQVDSFSGLTPGKALNPKELKNFKRAHFTGAINEKGLGKRKGAAGQSGTAIDDAITATGITPGWKDWEDLLALKGYGGNNPSFPKAPLDFTKPPAEAKWGAAEDKLTPAQMLGKLLRYQVGSGHFLGWNSQTSSAFNKPGQSFDIGSVDLLSVPKAQGLIPNFAGEDSLQVLGKYGKGRTTLYRGTSPKYQKVVPDRPNAPQFLFDKLLNAKTKIGFLNAIEELGTQHAKGQYSGSYNTDVKPATLEQMRGGGDLGPGKVQHAGYVYKRPTKGGRPRYASDGTTMPSGFVSKTKSRSVADRFSRALEFQFSADHNLQGQIHEDKIPNRRIKNRETIEKLVDYVGLQRVQKGFKQMMKEGKLNDLYIDLDKWRPKTEEGEERRSWDKGHKYRSIGHSGEGMTFDEEEVVQIWSKHSPYYGAGKGLLPNFAKITSNKEFQGERLKQAIVKAYKSKYEFAEGSGISPQVVEQVLAQYRKQSASGSAWTSGQAFGPMGAEISKREIDAFLSGGFIPNFANPLKEAIAREVGAGIPKSQIKVEQSGQLRGPGNPMGLAVTNKRDEPLGVGQGIRRARSMGIDPRGHGAASGLVPNFATGSGDEIDIPVDVLKLFSEELKETAKILESELVTAVKNASTTLTSLGLLAGDPSTAPSKNKEQIADARSQLKVEKSKSADQQDTQLIEDLEKYIQELQEVAKAIEVKASHEKDSLKVLSEYEKGGKRGSGDPELMKAARKMEQQKIKELGNATNVTREGLQKTVESLQNFQEAIHESQETLDEESHERSGGLQKLFYMQSAISMTNGFLEQFSEGARGATKTFLDLATAATSVTAAYIQQKEFVNQGMQMTGVGDTERGFSMFGGWEKSKSQAAATEAKIRGENLEARGGKGLGNIGKVGATIGKLGRTFGRFLPIVGQLYTGFTLANEAVKFFSKAFDLSAFGLEKGEGIMDLFASASDRATKRLEELSKTADSLKAALGGLETQEKEQIELRKLENKGTSRTIAEEKKYYDLRLKSIDTDIALSKAMGELMDENKTGRRSLERINRVIGDTTLSMSEQKEGIRDLIIANQMLMAATSQRTLFQEGIERADSDDDSARLLALGDTRGVQMGLAMGAAFEGKKGAKPGEKIAALSHNIKELEKAMTFRGGDAKGGLKNLNFDTSEAVGSTGITEMLRGAIQDIDEFQWNTGGLSDAESKAYKKSIQELINMLKKRKDAQSDGAKDDVDIRIASLKALKFALFNIEQERKRAKHTSEMILADRLHSSKLLSIKLGIEKEYEGISNQAHIELEAARAANDRQAKYQHDLKDARRNSIDALDKIVGKDLSDPGKLSQDVMTGLKSASKAEVTQALGEFQKRINASANFSGPLTIGSSPMTRTERQNVSGAFTAASGAASGVDAVMKLKALTEARKDLTAREQVAMASIMHKEGIISLEDEKRRLMTAELQKLEIILDKTDQEKGRADDLAKHETTKNLIAGKTVTGAQELYNRLIKGKDAAAIKEKLSGVINENLQGEADTLVVINEQQKSRLSIINGNLQFDRKAYETQVAKNRTESESALLALRQLEYQAMSLEGSNETRVIQEAKLRSEVITAGLSAKEAELRHEFLSVYEHRMDLLWEQTREEMSGLRTDKMLNREKLKIKLLMGDLEEAAELELREQETSLSTEALKNAHLAANLSHLKESGSLTHMANRLQEKSNKLIEAQNASRQAVLSRGDLAFGTKANLITERSGAIGETRGAAMRALMTNNPEDLLAFANSLEETNKQLDNGSRALDRLRSKMAEIEVSAANLGADLIELGFDGVRTGFKQLLEDIGSGTKSAGDAWRDFGLGLAKTLLDRITEHNIDRIVKDLTYAFTGVDPMSEAEKIASSNNHLVTANDRLIAALKSLEDEVARDKEVLKDKVLGTPSPDGTFNGIIEPPSTLGNINIPGLISGATPSGATPGGSGWSQRGGVWANRLNPPSVRSIPSLPAAGPPPTRPAAPTAPAQSVAALQLTAEKDYQLEIAKEPKRNEGLVKKWDWVGPYKGTKRVDRKEVPVTTPATFQQNPSWGPRSPHRIGRDKDLRTQGAYQTLMDQGDTSNFPMNTGVKPRQVKDAQVAMRTQISALEYDLGKATKEKEAYQKEEDIPELLVRHGKKASKILMKIARIKKELREKREIEEAIDALPEGRRALSASKSQVHLMENPAPQLLSSPIDTTIIDPFNAPGAESTTSDLEKTKEKLAGILAIDPKLFENKVPYTTPIVKGGEGGQTVEWRRAVESLNEGGAALKANAEALTGKEQDAIKASDFNPENKTLRELLNETLSSHGPECPDCDKIAEFSRRATELGNNSKSLEADQKALAKTTIESNATTLNTPSVDTTGHVNTTGDVNATGDVKTGPVTLNVTTTGKQGGGIIQHFADGGYVKGPGGKDKVPAMLTAGEFVVPKKGMDNVQKFNGGGLAGSNPQKKLWENDPEEPKGRAQRGIEGGLQAWAMIETANYMSKALNQDVDKPPTFNMKKLDSLDLGSDVSMKRGDPRLSARFLARDPVMQEYRDYLIEAANYKTQKKNEKFREDMGTLSSIFGAVTSFVTAELVAIAKPYIEKGMTKAENYFKGNLGLGKHSDTYQNLKAAGADVDYKDMNKFENPHNAYKGIKDKNGNVYKTDAGLNPWHTGAKNGGWTLVASGQTAVPQHRRYWTGMPQGHQGGGSIPAMLTAGEGYIPAPIAKRIGYNNLSHMNNTGSMPIVKGTGGVDNVGPVGLDSGDFIMKKSSTNKLLRDNPNAMRFSLQGQSDGRRGAQGYYEGGVVGSELTVPARSLGPQKSPQGNRLQLLDQKESEKSDSGAAGSTTNAETTNNININISIDKAGAEVESQEGGEDSYEKERNLSMKIKGAVLEVIREEKRIGGELS